jgi:UDP-glucose 4-epimerase
MSAAPDDALRGAVALVTGGAGFIGSRLCARLTAAGMSVHSASRRHHPDTADFRHVAVDLQDHGAVERLLDRVRPDYVFHLASHVQGAPDIKHVLPALYGNLVTTVNLLTAATSRDCRRVVLTGSFMEPDASQGAPVPTSPYAAAKGAAAMYGRMFHVLYHVPVTTARVFMVYGPGQQDLTKLVPYTILNLLRGSAPRITSGSRLVDWVFVDDVVEGFVRLALADGAVGATVDLGSGGLIATSDLVAHICRLIDPTIAPEIGALPDRPMEPTGTARLADSLRLVGWAPRVALDEGLRRTIEFYRHSGAA